MYRIIQETLTNIVKHAEATEAWVVVHPDQNVITITVRDNGKGFIVKPLYDHTKGTGFGLTGLKERVHILNGEMSITSMPGEGTTVEVVIPV